MSSNTVGKYYLSIDNGEYYAIYEHGDGEITFHAIYDILESENEEIEFLDWEKADYSSLESYLSDYTSESMLFEGNTLEEVLDQYRMLTL